MIVSHARRQTLGDLLRRTARRVPQRMALLCGETQWSYAELDAVVDNLCAALPGIGIEAGDKVAILARNSHAFIAMRFALAPCWCRSISCSTPTRSHSSCVTAARAYCAPIRAWRNWRARRRPGTPG